jgi:hypothetical protein
LGLCHLNFEDLVIVSACPGATCSDGFHVSQVWARDFDLPAIARDLPAIAVSAGIVVARRPWRWQAGAGT